MGHDMAPMARGVTDGKQDRLFLALSQRPVPRHPMAASEPDCQHVAVDTGWSGRRVDSYCLPLSGIAESVLAIRPKVGDRQKLTPNYLPSNSSGAPNEGVEKVR